MKHTLRAQSSCTSRTNEVHDPETHTEHSHKVGVEPVRFTIPEPHMEHSR